MTRFFFLLLLLPFLSLAQQPGLNPSKAPTGRFYGKVVDEKGGGIGYATVKLFGTKLDPATKKPQVSLIGGQLTAENGDFSLDQIPLMGEFRLVISFIGFTEIEKNVSFTAPNAAGTPKPAGPSGGFGLSEKDLGNVVLKANTTLEEVVVSSQAANATLSLDKKIYRVDKDVTAEGGTAQDALKNVPSVSVDADGSVTLRNGAPQIFVDGRPTTLTLDQIPAATIESVEVITNPSAKYDAGGGTAGIINIVLKKDRRLGYNGSVRTGTDIQKGYNLGGDLNARAEKWNFFFSGNLNRMRSINEGLTYRSNRSSFFSVENRQDIDGQMKGYFANLRTGIDWLMDNRNTLTFSGSLTQGQFNPTSDILVQTDSIGDLFQKSESYIRLADVNRHFQNVGGAVLFKHLFPKQGAEWTADFNFNRINSGGDNQFSSKFSNGASSLEQQQADGSGTIYTFQSDLVYPVFKDWKVESGVRAAIRRNISNNFNFRWNPVTEQWEQSSTLTDRYNYDDDVYAAYATIGKQFKGWSAQIGLRAESSFYTGRLTDRDSSFSINYPVSLFPSAFLTRQLSESSSLQMAYTRRVNRPNFFQTLPFIDFSDSLNLRLGNPLLLPEFTNSVELSYQKIFSRNHSLLASVYYRRANDLITSYLTTMVDSELDQTFILTTYANADYSQAAGLEMTIKNTFFKNIDITSNWNFFYTEVNANNVETGLVTERASALIKEIIQIRLKKGWSLQLNGEYRTRAAYTPIVSTDQFRGPHGSGVTNTAQGYSIANWYMDISVKKDFWERKASLTLSMNDPFRSRRTGTYSASTLFVQDSWTLRNPQMVRLNFSYRFGKADSSLFRRKNTKVEMGGNDMMGG